MSFILSLNAVLVNKSVLETILPVGSITALIPVFADLTIYKRVSIALNMVMERC